MDRKELTQSSYLLQHMKALLFSLLSYQELKFFPLFNNDFITRLRNHRVSLTIGRKYKVSLISCIECLRTVQSVRDNQ